MPPEYSPLDILWILVASGLVFSMQAGFALLESGLTRSKNSINVAMKNMTDLGVAILLFWTFGFGIMFGDSIGGWLGSSDFALDTESEDVYGLSFFLFQAMFCATAATIVSGAAAERMRYSSYILITIAVSGILYPLLGHWMWHEDGWLTQMGFVDFAGSTVVHGLGGWAGLAAIVLLGPREGRFTSDGDIRKIHGSNIPMSILGALLLWFGWFGFNGGSTLGIESGSNVAGIIVNTVLAGAAGMITALCVSWPIKKVADIEFMINGALAGLVAITANCHAVHGYEALMIGAGGGLVMLAGDFLLTRLRIDDAVGAVPVHAFAGAWGTIAVALFGEAELLGSGLSFFEQLSVQLAGVGVAFAWGFGLALLLFWITDRIMPLRVTAEQEETGLNIAEHGATTELIDLFQAMDRQAKTGDLGIRVPVEPFTEVGQIAKRYNTVIAELQKAMQERDRIFGQIDEGLFLLNDRLEIGGKYSEALDRIFQVQDHSLGGKNIANFLGDVLPPAKIEPVTDYLELMLKQDLDLAWVQDLNPLHEIEVRLTGRDGAFDRKTLQFRFTRIYDQETGRLTHLMGSVKDVSEQVRLAAELKKTRDETRAQMERLFSILHVDAGLLADFIGETNVEIDRINEALRADGIPLKEKLSAIFRYAHSIKGNAALLELHFVAEQAHVFEEKIAEIQQRGAELSGIDFIPLVVMLNRLRELMQEIDAMVARLVNFQSAFGADKVQARDLFLRRIEDVVKKLSSELGKEAALNSSNFDPERIPERYRKLVKDVLVQMVRNSLSHGIESPEERRAGGKQPRAEIRISAEIEADVLRFAVRDDGRGLQLEKLRELALKSGKWSEAELADWDEGKIARLIFQPGLSTADSADMLAGRGVGMDIIKQMVQDFGGKIRTSFASGKFTEFRISLPLDSGKTG